MQPSYWHYFLGRLLGRLYYRISVVGQVPAGRGVPTLFIASHRNGAMDGCVYLNAHGRVPTLVSVQLLRHVWQRLLFTGIPVVREKDGERYGIAKASVPSPIAAAVEQLRQGGSLVIFPEGSSEFWEKPLPYQAGMAMVALKLKKLGVPFQVQALGSFYVAPERFRSRVSIVAGAPFVPQGENLKALQAELGAALDGVSVRCPDMARFNAVQAWAFRAARQGADYGEAFLAAQAAEALPDAVAPAAVQHSWPWQNRLFALVFLPMAVAAGRAARYADGRNNVSLFRTLGALAALPLQGLYFVLWGGLHWAVPVGMLAVAAGLWPCLAEPTPVDLCERGE